MYGHSRGVIAEDREVRAKRGSAVILGGAGSACERKKTFSTWSGMKLSLVGLGRQTLAVSGLEEL